MAEADRVARRDAANTGTARGRESSRSVFESAVRHRIPSRLPVDYVASRDFDDRIRRHLGVSTERELLDALGCDFYYLSVRDISQNETVAPIYRGPALRADERYRVCPLGIRYLRGQYDWKFGADECVGGALDRAESPQDVLRHRLPRPEWFDVEALGSECEEFGERVIIGGFWTAIFGNAYRLYGFERFLMDMALRPEVIKTLIASLTDFYLELDERLFAALKGKMDIFYFGNDFGSQQGLLFSEAMWTEFFAESYRKIIDLAHHHGLTVMVHSCGSIADILPHFVELGVDIIDPVQTAAASRRGSTSCVSMAP